MGGLRLGALREKAFELRALNLAASVFLGLLVVGHGVVLIWTSRAVWSSAQAVEHDTRVIDMAHELDRTLREHQQLEHLRTVGRQPELQTVRSELESRLRRLL